MKTLTNNSCLLYKSLKGPQTKLCKLTLFINISPKRLYQSISNTFATFFKTVLSSGYILILLSIEYILASLIEMCQG